MKKDTLKVGTSKGEFYVEVEISIPESIEDVNALAKNDAEYVISKFTRGYRIDLQEGGARQVVAEMLGGKSPAQAMRDVEFVAKVKAAVEAEIAAFDPKAPRARGTRAKPAPTVTLAQGKKQYSAAELLAMLEAAGVKVISEG